MAWAHEGIARVLLQQGNLNLAQAELDKALAIRSLQQDAADGKELFSKELVQLHLMSEQIAARHAAQQRLRSLIGHVVNTRRLVGAERFDELQRDTANRGPPAPLSWRQRDSSRDDEGAPTATRMPSSPAARGSTVMRVMHRLSTGLRDHARGKLSPREHFATELSTVGPSASDPGRRGSGSFVGVSWCGRHRNSALPPLETSSSALELDRETRDRIFEGNAVLAEASAKSKASKRNSSC